MKFRKSIKKIRKNKKIFLKLAPNRRIWGPAIRKNDTKYDDDIEIDLNKYNIRKDAAIELDKIVKVMNDSATTFGPKETTADDTMIDETINETISFFISFCSNIGQNIVKNGTKFKDI